VSKIYLINNPLILKKSNLYSREFLPYYFVVVILRIMEHGKRVEITDTHQE
jgi:hypothetical protein